MVSVPKYYIADTSSRSGIAIYADDFFRVVMQKKGFVFVAPEMVTPYWAAQLPKETVLHVELGSGLYAERNALMRLVASGFRNIDVTVHDPPWITFPFYRSKFHLLNKISKAFDWYVNGFGATGRLLKRCRQIFVLTAKGRQLLEKRHGLTNVRRIPHVIDPAKIWSEQLQTGVRDILFFGFIGAVKGLEYALSLHAEIRKYDPDIRIYIVGQAFNHEARNQLEKLMHTYRDGVEYVGYVEDMELDGYFSKASHVFLPFLPYKYWCPCSGSVLNALRRGRIVWTNPVNAVPEIVQDEVNGLFLSGNLGQDASRFRAVSSDPALLLRISNGALNTCHDMHRDLESVFQTSR